MAILSAPALPAAAPSVLRRAAAVLAEPRRALLAAVVVLSAVVGLDALSDADVWWHVQLGNWILAHHQIPQTDMFSYTVNGAVLAPHEWLAGAVFAALYGAGGLFVLALVMGVVAFAGLAAVALHARLRGAGPLTIALGLALAAKAAQPVLGIRPQVFTFAFLAITLLLTERHLRRGGRAIWVLPPLYVLWANLHGGFVAGLAFMLIAAAVAAVGWRFRFPNHVPITRAVRVAAVAAVCAAVACINPQGIGSYRFALSEATGEGAKGIIEWQPPNFTDPGLWPLLILIALFAVMGVMAAMRRRIAVRDAVPAVIACAAALLAVRNAAVCVAVVAPVVMGWTADAVRRPATPRVTVRPIAAAAVVAGAIVVAAACAGLGIAVARLQTSAAPAGVATVYPACAASVLERAPAGENVFTAYGDSGYMAMRLWPHGHVYIYGASDAFTTADFTSYRRIASGATVAPSALDLLRASGTTAVLVQKGALTNELAHTAGWTYVLTDHSRELYVSGDASWASRANC